MLGGPQRCYSSWERDCPEGSQVPVPLRLPVFLRFFKAREDSRTKKYQLGEEKQIHEMFPRLTDWTGESTLREHSGEKEETQKPEFVPNNAYVRKISALRNRLGTQKARSSSSVLV